ncbi:NADase-type glycan-binding domain-containing protein [Streptomyces sp. NBC_01006]|uniref:NADase-type glycan-binding domain-containing protein n=1 Tax=Streptomyces sp. NBC_01006 TaxID=2903716 RepID=UPI003865AB15|nr:zinc ribbon domain-containing protein [Streptomyces sp. NBC_01006]
MTSQTPVPGARSDRAAHCAECGTRAEPDQSFCDSCGAVLGWADRAGAMSEAAGGEAVARDPAPAAEAAADTAQPAPAPRGASAEGPGTSGSGPAEPGGTESGGTESGRTESGGTEGVETAATSSMLTAAVAPAADDASTRARSLLVPVADPEPREAVPPSVAPVLPGRSVADRPQVRTPGRETGVEGGPPCPWCATPNRPDRHFCGVCAMPLAGSPAVPGRRPWWRRVLDFRNRETPWAGDRPRLRRGFGYLMTWALWALVLTLLIAAVVNADTAVNAVRDHFAKRTPVGPDSVEASHAYPGNDPQLAFDKLNNTWWGPGISQSGAGEWVEARFDRPTRLLDVIITPGVSTRADKLSQSALPRRVEAVITTSDGRTATRVLTLDQAAGGQRRTFRAGNVTAVRFVLRSAYAAAPDKQVAIAEIEFFGPSNSSRSQ